VISLAPDRADRCLAAMVRRAWRPSDADPLNSDDEHKIVWRRRMTAKGSSTGEQGVMSCSSYSRKVPQPARTRVHSRAPARTVTCGDGLRWMCCLLMACKRLGFESP
jgi:hypothetical protein